MAQGRTLNTNVVIGGRVAASMSSAFGRVQRQSAATSGSLNKMAKATSSAAGFMGKSIKIAALSIATSTGVCAVALGGIVLKATESADKLDSLRQKTGLTAEQLQKLQYISGQVGANFDAIPKAVNILTKNMDAARNGSKATAAVFGTLGVKVSDLSGKLRPQSEVFQETLLQLSKMKNVTERNALAFKVFGKGAADMFPILNSGADGIKQMSSEAVKMGMVMSGKQVTVLDNFGDTIDKVKMTLAGFGNQVAANVAPALQKFFDSVDLNKIGGLVASVSGTIFDKLGSILPTVMNLAQQFAPVIGSVFDILTSSPIIPAVLSTLQELAPVIISTFKQIAPIIKDAFGMLGSTLKKIIPMVVPLVKTLLPLIPIVLKLVMAVLKPLLPVAIKIIGAVSQIISKVAVSLGPMLSALTPVISMIANLIANNISNALNTIMPIINSVTGILTNLIDFVTNVFTGNWSGAWNNIVGIFGNLFAGIGNIAIAPLNTIINLINTVISGFNKIKLPSWIPGIGGMGVNIPLIPNIPTFATGGIATKPSIFGEAGPEIAIPLNKNPRSYGLLNKAANMLGVRNNGFSRKDGLIRNNNSNTNVTVSLTVHAPGGNPQKVAEATEGVIENVMDKYFARRRRVAFG